jgi:hypothetical protein
VIHCKGGQIQQKDSHGNDPFPPKGYKLKKNHKKKYYDHRRTKAA